MVTMSCPWCEAEMRFEPAELAADQMTCEDCRTSWLIDAPEPRELALAA